MTPQRINDDIITPALGLLPRNMDTVAARVAMLAICGQEADFRHRWQVLSGGGKGPARGLWQFERSGGVRGVLNHLNTRAVAGRIAQQRIGSSSPDAVWQALEHDDLLAAVFARLLLWSDPKSLPPVGQVDAAWQLYLRVWRPGAVGRGTDAQRVKLRQKWGEYYERAVKSV